MTHKLWAIIYDESSKRMRAKQSSENEYENQPKAPTPAPIAVPTPGRIIVPNAAPPAAPPTA